MHAQNITVTPSYPLNFLPTFILGYPVCESCINGCNCPLPLEPITPQGTAHTSVNTTCSFKPCGEETAQDCHADALCLQFPDGLRHICTCKPGFTGNGSFCEDINECANNVCSVNAHCTNTNGSFSCFCHVGYIGDGFNCTDIDECTDSIFPCPLFSRCTNSPGSFSCSCQQGYFPNGTACADVDECQQQNLCQTYQKCTNTIGSYLCTCNDGFRLNGSSCIDINECAPGYNNGCHPNATCTNSIGGFACSCKGGFQGDGFSCTDLDECSEDPSPCHNITANCTNTIGSYLCKCINGYRYSETAKKCEAIVYPRGLSISLGVIVGFCLLVGIFAALLLVTHWDLFTKIYGAFFCAIVIAGVLIAEVSALTQLPKPTDSLCVAFPWLLGIGFTLVYSCLFIKTWMLFRIWNHAMKLKRFRITAYTVIRYVGIALCIEIVFLGLWTAVDSPKAQYVQLNSGEFQLRCRSKTRTFWGVFLALKGIWLVLGAGIAIVTRNILKQYSEFTSIVYAVYNNLILMAIAIPLALLLWDIPNGSVVITVIVIVLAFMFTLGILFFDVWVKILLPQFSDSGSPSSSARSVDSSSAQDTNAHTTNIELQE